MKLLLLALVFFVLGALFIVSNDGLSLYKLDHRQQFTSEYSTWISHLFSNSRSIVGYVVQSDWLPSGNQSTLTLK